MRFRNIPFFAKWGKTLRVLEGGQGPVLICFHGGPGLDGSYLQESLKAFLKHRKVIAFNQLGCDKAISRNKIQAVDWPQTLAHARDAVFAITSHYRESNSLGAETKHRPKRKKHRSGGQGRAQSLEEMFGFFGHSWGTHLALSVYYSLEPQTQRRLREMFLVSPYPLTQVQAKKMAARIPSLISNLPQKSQRRLSQIFQEAPTAKQGLEIMNLLKPLYFSSEFPKAGKHLKFGFYNPEVDKKVLDSQGSYDWTSALDELPAKTWSILGSRDFIHLQEVRELFQVRSGFIFPGVGHSPFAEVPWLWKAVIEYICLQK